MSGSTDDDRRDEAARRDEANRDENRRIDDLNRETNLQRWDREAREHEERMARAEAMEAVRRESRREMIQMMALVERRHFEEAARRGEDIKSDEFRRQAAQIVHGWAGQIRAEQRAVEDAAGIDTTRERIIDRMSPANEQQLEKAESVARQREYIERSLSEQNVGREVHERRLETLEVRLPDGNDGRWALRSNRLPNDGVMMTAPAPRAPAPPRDRGPESPLQRPGFTREYAEQVIKDLRKDLRHAVSFEDYAARYAGMTSDQIAHFQHREQEATRLWTTDRQAARQAIDVMHDEMAVARQGRLADFDRDFVELDRQRNIDPVFREREMSAWDREQRFIAAEQARTAKQDPDVQDLGGESRGTDARTGGPKQDTGGRTPAKGTDDEQAQVPQKHNGSRFQGRASMPDMPDAGDRDLTPDDDDEIKRRRQEEAARLAAERNEERRGGGGISL